jgi:hypothetical protein
MNAVLDAMRHAGVREFDMPATPLRVWQALEGAKQEQAKHNGGAAKSPQA